MKVRPKRPYLLRAMYEWIVDSELTPYVLAAATDPRVIVPQHYVTDGRIVLNISPSAVRDLHIDDDSIRFSGRFAGRAFDIVVPVTHLLAIYAKETGEGMMFEAEEPSAEAPARSSSADESPDAEPKHPGGPHLSVIK